MADEVTEQENAEILDAKSCSGLRRDMLDCIVKSDCMRRNGTSFHKCLEKETPGVDTDCRKVQFLFFECKRAMLDMRQRFRPKKGY